MKKAAALFLCLWLLQAAISQTVFSGLDINAENRLLFTTSYTNLLRRSEQALFVSSVTGAKPAVLTCSPEKMEVLNGGTVLQLRNWYGSARYSIPSDSLTWTYQSPFFVTGIPASAMTVEPVSVSPNGLWTVVFKKKSAAYGDLVLHDVKKSVSVTIASDLELDLNDVPVSWASDSSLFIYEKTGGLYFAKPSQLFVTNPLSDRYRRLGSGTINAVYWASSSLLVYLCDGNVFAVSAGELQIRALYAGFVTPGKLAGTIPGKFDSRSDRFWTASDASAIVLVQNNRTVLYLTLTGTDYRPVWQTSVQPLASFKENVFSIKAFWPANLQPVLWVDALEGGKTTHNTFRFSEKGLVSLSLPAGARDPSLSPDKTELAFNSDTGLYIYDIEKWQQKAVFSGEPVRCFAWAKDSALYVAGTQTVRYWNIHSSVAQVLFLSRADAYGWNPSGQKIVAAAAAGFFEYVPATNVWKPTTEPIRPSQTQNASLRVFVENDSSGLFGSSIYARSVSGISSTKDIFAETSRIPLSAVQQQKKLALAFDALDNADGLAVILKTLNEYSITATFFINGEFIQRYPQAVREIAAAGHQCGSMFFTNFDFADPQFIADSNFILKGLARTEEDFFAVTGKDLSPIWHTPNYIINSTVRDIAAKAGYAYIDRGFAPLDWVSLETGINTPGLYLPSSAIIAAVAESLKNGIVLPVSVGLPSGVRFDYVYDNLDVLIQAIVGAGYKIVTVTEIK